MSVVFGPILGSGRYGTVYKGKYNDQTCVVKVPTVGQSSQDSAKRELLAGEAIPKDIVAQVNIACPYTANVKNGKITQLISKFVKGVELDELNTLDIQTVDKIFIDVLSALCVCHSYNVAHRDVKPVNILYDQDTETAVLIDFGLCSNGPSSKLRGSPKYISKELYEMQLRMGKNFRVDLPALYRGDIFALGMTMYFIANKRAPFIEYPREAPLKGFNFSTYRSSTYKSNEISSYNHDSDDINDMINRMILSPGRAEEILQSWAPKEYERIKEYLK